eukprot:1582382-Alexandrium_andersonii.AAC.1
MLVAAVTYGQEAGGIARGRLEWLRRAFVRSVAGPRPRRCIMAALALLGHSGRDPLVDYWVQSIRRWAVGVWRGQVGQEL